MKRLTEVRRTMQRHCKNSPGRDILKYQTEMSELSNTTKLNCSPERLNSRVGDVKGRTGERQGCVHPIGEAERLKKKKKKRMKSDDSLRDTPTNEFMHT